MRAMLCVCCANKKRPAPTGMKSLVRAGSASSGDRIRSGVVDRGGRGGAGELFFDCGVLLIAEQTCVEPSSVRPAPRLRLGPDAASQGGCTARPWRRWGPAGPRILPASESMHSLHARRLPLGAAQSPAIAAMGLRASITGSLVVQGRAPTPVRPPPRSGWLRAPRRASARRARGAGRSPRWRSSLGARK